MQSTLILAMGVSLAAAAGSPFTNPVFYTSADCTGVADPKAALWSYAAQDTVAVKPFATAGAELSGHTIDACLTDSTVAYSVMLKIDDTACPAKGAEALQLSYWKASKTCEGTAEVKTLKADTCVVTALGSAKFNPSSLTVAEQCIVTNYLLAMKKGGVKTRSWTGNKCSGKEKASTTESLSQKACGAEPECDGCCQSYDAKCKVVTSPSYTSSQAACNKVAGGGWVASLVESDFSDAKCIVQDNKTPASRLVRNLGSCATGTSNGATLSLQADLVAPLTLDIHCQYVQLNANKSVDGYLTWEEFNKQYKKTVNASSPAAHPATALLVTLLVALVLLF